MTPPIVMTIGGSDSGAGAGIQADLKTLAAHRVYATTVLTTVTAQNTVGVRRVEPLSIKTIDAQLEALSSDLAPDAAKTGLLGREEVVRLIADRAPLLPNLVIDPVLVDRHGRELSDRATVKAYLAHLIPAGRLATPNHLEAALLAGRDEKTRSGLKATATHLARATRTPFLITGGRLDKDRQPVDVFSDGIETHTFPGRRVSTRNVHGTGDALSAAIAARLAEGEDLLMAIAESRAWVARAIAGASDWRLGRGEGPIDHFGWG